DRRQIDIDRRAGGDRVGRGLERVDKWPQGGGETDRAERPGQQQQNIAPRLRRAGSIVAHARKTPNPAFAAAGAANRRAQASPGSRFRNAKDAEETRRTRRGSPPSRPLRLLERDEIGTNRRSRSVARIAASAAPPRHDGDMVIASAATQSPALCARIAASALPPRNDGDMVIASVATQSPALCAGIPVALPVATG